MPDHNSAHPKVFISYSWYPPINKERVLKLSNKLRQDGIDSEIDQYIDSPPKGWPQWMVNQIQGAHFVLVVCTEGVQAGRGTQWEGALILQHMYNEGANNKFIPVLLESGRFEDIPVPLQGSTFYCVDTTEGYENLYRRLTNQPLNEAPKLGDLKNLSPLDILDRTQGFSKEFRQSLLNKLKALIQMQGEIYEGRVGDHGNLWGTGDTYDSHTWPREVEIIPTGDLEGHIRAPYDCMVRHKHYIAQVETGTKDNQHPAIITARYSIEQSGVVHISGITFEGDQVRRCGNSIRARLESINGQKLS